MNNAPKYDQTSEWPENTGHPAGVSHKTDEYSFILRPDSYGGIGVFATHDIKAGVLLHLYDESNGYVVHKTVTEDTVPGEFIKFCTDEGNGMVTRPANFSRVDIVWYLNHSDKPNAGHMGDYHYRALRPIAAGEEIVIDYNTVT